MFHPTQTIDELMRCLTSTLQHDASHILGAQSLLRAEAANNLHLHSKLLEWH